MNMDQLYLVQRIVADGEAPIEHSIHAPGGSAANTIYGLARLGISTGFIGAIGDDDAGRMLLRDLNSSGVDSSQIQVARQAVTGTVVCLVDHSGRRALYVSPGANRMLSVEDIDMDYLNQADIIHLSSFVDKEQLDIQKHNIGFLLKYLLESLFTIFGLQDELVRAFQDFPDQLAADRIIIHDQDFFHLDAPAVCSGPVSGSSGAQGSVKLNRLP